jgi:hypothetical protein
MVTYTLMFTLGQGNGYFLVCGGVFVLMVVNMYYEIQIMVIE